MYVIHETNVGRVELYIDAIHRSASVNIINAINVNRDYVVELYVTHKLM